MAADNFFDASPSAPPAPASPGPTVDLETATMGLPPSMTGPAENPALNQPTFGGPPDPEALPRPPRPNIPPRGAETPPPPSPEQVAAFGRQLQTLEKRLTDTQTSFHEERERANMLTGQLMQAAQAAAQPRAAPPAPAPELAPPQLSEEQLEALVTDPAAVRNLTAAERNYAIQRSEATTAPLVQWAQGASALNAVQQQLLEEIAVEKARALTASEGISNEQFDQMIEPTKALLRQSYSHPVQQAATMLNPEALRWGMKMAMQQKGQPLPVQGQPPAPPSPPSGNAPTTRNGAAKGKPMSVRLAESRLGITIPREKWENNSEIGGR